MAGFDPPVDANGATITVGATVKLVGTVASINSFDNRYNDIVVTLLHPVITTPSSSNPAIPGVNLTGGDPSVPGYRTTISVPPTVLVVGS